MSKKNILTVLLDLLFVVVFNLLFFMNGGANHAAVVWICYGFLHFAYLMVLLTPLLAAKGSFSHLSKTSTYAISLLFLIAEIVFFLVVFFVPVENSKIVVSVQVVLTAVYLLVLIINLLADDATEQKQSRHDAENQFVKDISARLKYLETVARDSQTKNKINSLYYLAHSSPIKSDEKVSETERQISEQIAALESLCGESKTEEVLTLAGKIENLLTKRNGILKAIR